MGNKFRKYLVSVSLCALPIILLFVALNFFMDPFGLYSSSKGRNLQILTSERPSKYLLSLRYVPENFDGILVGPSLSDHLDTAAITSNRVYNLSLQGANSTEMRLMASNVMQNSQIKLLIICLDPYIVRDMDINDERMKPQLKRAALGSTFMLQYYSDLVYSSATGGASQFGIYGNLMIKAAPEGPETAIKNFVKFLGDNDMEVPESYYRASVSELKGMVDEAHSRNVRIAAFFFPMPDEVFAVTAKRYISFRKVVSSLFRYEDILIDFTSPEYAQFREDYSNYSDQGHLSEKGARYLVAEIDKAIAARQGR